MANNYILRLRRGIRYVNNDGTTLLDSDGTPVRDDWTTYTAQEDHIDPLEGELVLEYEVVQSTGKKTPRLKIGDGISTFAELSYISVDSFILPKPVTVTIYADKWTQAEDGRWYQIVAVDNAIVTSNSKIDLQPSAEQLVLFRDRGLVFVTENEDGVISVFCIGQVPADTYTIQATVTEVAVNG